MKRKFRRNLKGVSTVIATIIIVAIAIVMAIATAYWILGIGSSFTRFEKIEFTSAYANFAGASGNYTIIMTLKNTGSAAATIDPATIFYNGKPAEAYIGDAPFANFQTFTMNPGNITQNLQILIKSGGNFTSSMNLEVMIQTTAGRQYPKVITLP